MRDLIIPCPSNIDDITGKTFGCWTVLGFIDTYARKSRFLCECRCGETKLVYRFRLVSGGSENCWKCQQFKANHPREYESWSKMKDRCDNPKYPYFHRYGGRGISYAISWSKFKEFLADMGPCPSGLTLERIDNDVNYHAGNCTWATRQAQANNRSTNRFITVDGDEMTLADASRRYGQNIKLISKRLTRGWCHECASKIASGKGSCVHRFLIKQA